MIHIPDWLKITALAAGLRFWGIVREDLWFDEIFTAWVIRPGTDFWRAVIGDNHPPLWNVLLGIVVRIFGQSAFTMRFPALLFGVGAVWLVWLIARQFLNRRTALTAGLIAAMLPAAVYFAQDARMYSSLAFFVLLMIYATLKHRDLLYILAGLGAVYTHNVGICFVLAIGLAYALARGSWRALWPSALIALGWLPWAGVVLTQVGRVAAGYWPAPLSLGGALYPGILVTLGWRMAEGVQVPAIVVIILLSMITLWTIRRWVRHPVTWPLLAAIAGGPLALLAFSLVIANVWVYRALLPAGLLLCIPWAYTLQRLQTGSGRYVRLLFAFALGIALLSHYYPIQSRPAVYDWLAPIRAGWQDGDLIYYLNMPDAVAYVPYAPYPYAVRPTPASLLTISADCRAAFGLVETPLPQVKARRIWVAFHQTPYTPQAEVDFFEALKRYPHREVERQKDSVLYWFELDNGARIF